MAKLSKNALLQIKHESECEKNGFSGQVEFIKLVSWNSSEVVVKVREKCNTCGVTVQEEELTYYRGD